VLASGAAYVLAFPALDLGVLAWVTLVPLLLAARHRSPRRAFRLGYLWGIIAYGGVLGG
jgi:apolipoprotein N-acyltransferase